MTSVEVRGAIKSYEKQTFVLNGLNLTVETGSIYGLLGASGCGKTTLLSCILGIKKLDKGSIKIFGQEISPKDETKFSHVIGYMPQTISLVPELTIKETLYYFGNINQMDAHDLKIRFKMLCDLMELEDQNKLVKQLSGGQKRRVSLAAVLIHNPKILVLDEPTVGLDPILRDKIWKFLIDITSTSSVSVIITTHYISECESANRCGLMRHGVLLAEASPRTVIGRYGVLSLDEAFLSLCVAQTNNRHNTIAIDNNNDINFSLASNKSASLDRIESNVLDVSKEKMTEKLNKRKHFTKQTLKTLLVKEVTRFRRTPTEVLFMIIFPLSQIVSFALAIGLLPKNLKLGIVNYEVNDRYFCEEYLKSANYTFNTTSCDFEYLSCHFIHEIEKKTAEKIYYDSYDDAYRDAKEAKLHGFFTIQSNFSKLTTLQKSENDASIARPDANTIKVYLDQTSTIISNFIKVKLYKSFKRFNKKLLWYCDMGENIENEPINYEYFYGTNEDQYQKSISPGVLVQVIVLTGILFSISTISQSRKEGVWNRTLLAGVTTSEILTIYIIIFCVINIIQTLVLIASLAALMDLNIVKHWFLLSFFGYITSMLGSCVGSLVAILTNNTLIHQSAGLVFFFTGGILCGAFWPLEGQQIILRIISYMFPTTLLTVSFTDIIIKDFDLNHLTVYGGFLSAIAYIIGIIAICLVLINRKKFTEEST